MLFILTGNNILAIQSFDHGGWKIKLPVVKNVIW